MSTLDSIKKGEISPYELAAVAVFGPGYYEWSGGSWNWIFGTNSATWYCEEEDFDGELEQHVYWICNNKRYWS